MRHYDVAIVDHFNTKGHGRRLIEFYVAAQ